jgi:Fe-S-cluster containining protein
MVHPVAVIESWPGNVGTRTKIHLGLRGEMTLGHRLYNCAKCPGYCCSYPLIPLTKRDVERLAEHFNLSFEEARTKFTKEDSGEKYAMRRKADKYFGRVCRFFDTEERRCTIYAVRPYACRSYPGGRCGYYDFLMAERSRQDDPEFVATTQND